MKICRFRYQDESRWGQIFDDQILPIEDLENLGLREKNDSESAILNIADVVILPPVAPSKIVCVGRNYAEHAAELGNEIPKSPLLFLKAPSSIIGHDSAILIPPQSAQVEHEGELAVVIGRECKNLADEAQSLEYVFGYTCLNDVTARDLQRQDVQFTRAKSFDTFCPVGAYIETDLDVSDIRVATTVNGIVRQAGRTSQMTFSVAYLIKYISNQMTLKVGDVIATGTPAGVSKLSDGDICEIEIEGIGTLRNPVKIYTEAGIL